MIKKYRWYNRNWDYLDPDTAQWICQLTSGSGYQYYINCDDLKEYDELHQEDFKETVEFILFFKSSWWKEISVARNLIHFVPQTAMTTFALTSIFILLYGTDLGLHVPPEGGEVGAGWIQEGGVPDHLGQEALPVLFDPDHIGCTDARGSGTY